MSNGSFYIERPMVEPPLIEMLPTAHVCCGWTQLMNSLPMLIIGHLELSKFNYFFIVHDILKSF